MKCGTCGIDGHDSQGDKMLCYVALRERCKSVPAALETLAKAARERGSLESSVLVRLLSRSLAEMAE